ncbi:MAG: hypothetical protein GY866_35765 [Proteobacteria bacterium]|nr:hypothetical protein [Pseudomonadota bacterium]
MGRFKRSIDWFIPETFRVNLEDMRRGRLLVASSLVLFFLWLAFSVRQETTVMIFGIAGGAFVLLMPLVFKETASISLAGNGIVGFITLSDFYLSYVNGGGNSSIFWWCALAPVIAVLLLGNRWGLFWFLVNLTGIQVFYRLVKSGYEFPSRQAASFQVVGYEQIIPSIIGLAVVMSLLALFLENSKNKALKKQQAELAKSKELSDKLQGIVEEIQKNAVSLRSSLEELSWTSKEMQDNADDMAETEVEAAAAVNQSYNTIQEMASSLQETTKEMQELRETTQTTEEEGKYGEKTVIDAGQAINKIKEGSREIEIVLEVITEIADSAHLLSLNAAIQAAKAGEYGKGFSVVVAEIRELAERSNDAVVTIRKLMKQSKYVISSGEDVIADTLEVFKKIIKYNNDISNQVREISVSISEQDIGIQEIAKGAEEISTVSIDNAALVQELSQSLEAGADTIENLSKITEDMDDQVSPFKVA